MIEKKKYGNVFNLRTIFSTIEEKKTAETKERNTKEGGGEKREGGKMKWRGERRRSGGKRD